MNPMMIIWQFKEHLDRVIVYAELTIAPLRFGSGRTRVTSPR
jgi:hypothetical protein